MTHPQLCQLAGDFVGKLPDGGALAEQKIDGFRATWFTGIDGTPRLWTRNGIPIGGIDHIAKRLRAMEREAGERMMFDGELQVDGTLSATKAWCERGWKQGGNAGHLHLFDCLTYAEWRAGGSDTPLWQRKRRLVELVEATAPDPDAWEWEPGSKGRVEPPPLSVLPDEWVCDAGDVLALAQDVWAAGGEGLMLKNPEAPYQRRRTNAWLKVKQCNVMKWRMAA